MQSKDIKKLEKIAFLIKENKKLNSLNCIRENSCDLNPIINLVNDVTGDYELLLKCSACQSKEEIPTEIIHSFENNTI